MARLRNLSHSGPSKPHAGINAIESSFSCNKSNNHHMTENENVLQWWWNFSCRFRYKSIKWHLLLINWDWDYSLVRLLRLFICAHLYHSTQLKLICLVTQVFYSQLDQSTFLAGVLLNLNTPTKNIIEGNWDQFSFYQMINLKLQIFFQRFQISHVCMEQRF